MSILGAINNLPLVNTDRSILLLLLLLLAQSQHKLLKEPSKQHRENSHPFLSFFVMYFCHTNTFSAKVSILQNSFVENVYRSFPSCRKYREESRKEKERRKECGGKEERKYLGLLMCGGILCMVSSLHLHLHSFKYSFTSLH